MFLLDILYVLILLLLGPMVGYRMARHGRYKQGVGEKLGYVAKRESDKPCIWLHAVSMGEVNATRTLVEQLKRDMPNYEIVISTTTDTGYNQAMKLYGGEHKVFFFPLDVSWFVKRTFKQIRPSLVVLMELELWPNFSAVAKKLNVPIVVSNGRISAAKGFPRYKKIAWLVRPIFKRLTLALVQEEEYASRFEYLGTAKENIKVVGTIKYDTADVTDNVPGAEELAASLDLDSESKLWVCGSTGSGEEAILLEAYKKLVEGGFGDLRLVLVPRKPERFNEVASLIEAENYDLIRYSEIKDGGKVEGKTATVILGDTMGDLRKFYGLAKIIFVGRSLVPMGGSDMIEAVALGKAVIVGPYTENFAQTMKLLKNGKGIEEVKDVDLVAKMTELLRDSAKVEDLANKGRDLIVANKGATDRTVKCLMKILGS